MERLQKTFVILLVSRILGIAREFFVISAYGFSRLTDIFYIVSWPIIGITTLANGPFTTAFSALYSTTPPESKRAIAKYYLRASILCALLVFGLSLCVTAILNKLGHQYLTSAMIIMSFGAFNVIIIGYFYALATACGLITIAALLLLATNGSFVLGLVIYWLTELPLTENTLPLLLIIGTLIALFCCLPAWQAISKHQQWPSEPNVPQSSSALAPSLFLASLETIFFLLSQGVLLFLASLSGAGWVSAILFVQRVVFTIIGLAVNPFSIIVMLRVVQHQKGGRSVFSTAIFRTAIGLILFVILCGFLLLLLTWISDDMEYAARSEELQIIRSLAPSYGLWVIAIGLNIIICRTMFGLRMQKLYTTATVSGYLLANFARLLSYQFLDLNWAIAIGALCELCVVAWLFTKVQSQLEYREG